MFIVKETGQLGIVVTSKSPHDVGVLLLDTNYQAPMGVKWFSSSWMATHTKTYKPEKNDLANDMYIQHLILEHMRTYGAEPEALRLFECYIIKPLEERLNRYKRKIITLWQEYEEKSKR